MIYDSGISHGCLRFRRLLANTESTSWLFATGSAITRTGYNRVSRAFVAYYSFTTTFFVTVVLTKLPSLSAEDGSAAGLILAYFFNVFFGLLVSIAVGMMFLKDMLSSPPALTTLSKNVDETISKADDLYYNYKPPKAPKASTEENEKSIYKNIIIFLLFPLFSGGMWYVVYYFMKSNFSPISLAYEIVLTLLLYIIQQLVSNYFQNEIIMRHSFTSLYNKMMCDGCDFVDEIKPRDEVTRPTLVAIISHDSENTVKSVKKMYQSELQWNSERLDEINKRWELGRPKPNETNSAGIVPVYENPMNKNKKRGGGKSKPVDRLHTSHVPSGSLGVFNLLSGNRNSSEEFD